MACGSREASASSDSTAPLGLPGRFKISDRWRTTATPRESMAAGVTSAPFRRISSASPGITFSPISRVASGVLSRGPSPVPPVLRTKSTVRESASFRKFNRTCSGSSEHFCAETISQPSSRQRWTTAGPERSTRSPLATESLMVRTATRIMAASWKAPRHGSPHPSGASLP